MPDAAAAAAVDKFGNVSEISDIVYATPISTMSNSTVHDGGQSCAFDRASWRGRSGIFASLLGIGLLAFAQRRRCEKPRR
jgi:hypothetical protein